MTTNVKMDRKARKNQRTIVEAKQKAIQARERARRRAADGLRVGDLTKDDFKQFGRKLPEYGIIISTLTLFVVLSIASDVFLTQANLFNILDQQAALGVVACGVTVAVLAGGFDLSVGAVYAMAAILAAKVGLSTSPALGLTTAVLVGLGFGMMNGSVVTLGKLQPFIATLATSMVIRGIALVVTGGFVISVADPSFGTIGNTAIAGVAATIWILLGFVAFTWFVLSRTTFGRQVYAVGGNPEAARLSGIRVDWIRFLTFSFSGLCAGVAGMIDVSRVSSAQAGIGSGMELTALAAVAIGGSSIAGGEGAVWRSVMGVFLLALINNGFNLLGIDPTYQNVMLGSLIIAAIALDSWSKRRRR
jgi:ribose transport system permease protein